jgi:hypothetical protein
MTDTKRKIIRPSPIALPDGLSRTPPRPPEFRQSNYEELFDHSTLIYDVFEYKNRIMAVGPPLLNLSKPARHFEYLWKSQRQDAEISNLNRMSRWSFSPSGARSGRSRSLAARIRHRMLGFLNSPTVPNDEFEIRFGRKREAAAKVGENCISAFSGKRCLLTKSKNNELRWIRDWVDFHVKAHGANALLFYDNGSDRYAAQDILDIVRDVENLDVAYVVEWPFKWGPHGEGTGRWDSDFAQHGMLEHARWRFLENARSVLYQDVDELALSRRSVFEIAETSTVGSILFDGQWIENVLEQPQNEKPIRHFDFFYYDPTVAPASPKWCAVPLRNAPAEQWRVHWVTPAEKTDQVVHRHFRGITTSWKIPRPAQPLDQNIHLIDTELVDQFRELDLVNFARLEK